MTLPIGSCKLSLKVVFRILYPDKRSLLVNGSQFTIPGDVRFEDDLQAARICLSEIKAYAARFASDCTVLEFGYVPYINGDLYRPKVNQQRLIPYTEEGEVIFWQCYTMLVDEIRQRFNEDIPSLQEVEAPPPTSPAFSSTTTSFMSNQKGTNMQSLITVWASADIAVKNGVEEVSTIAVEKASQLQEDPTGVINNLLNEIFGIVDVTRLQLRNIEAVYFRLQDDAYEDINVTVKIDQVNPAEKREEFVLLAADQIKTALATLNEMIEKNKSRSKEEIRSSVLQNNRQSILAGLNARLIDELNENIGAVLRDSVNYTETPDSLIAKYQEVLDAMKKMIKIVEKGAKTLK